MSTEFETAPEPGRLMELQRGRRWMRLALAAWIVFAVALCVKVLVQGIRHSVYGAFVIGPRGWWAGATLYDDRSYFYSPTFSVLFTPFAVLPDWLGQMLWGLFSITLFFWSLRVFYRDVLPRHWPIGTEAVFLLLVLIGAGRGIWSLQSNAVLMACILFAAAAIVRCRWWRAAWLLAAPVYIKVWPAVAAGLLGALWPRKLIGRLTLTGMALGLVPFLTKAPPDVVGYYRAWVARLTQRQANVERFTGYRDAWTIWEQIQPVNGRAYFVLEATAGLAVLGWCLWLRRSRCEQARSVEEIVTYTLAAWTCWQLLFGPGTERLTYLIAAPFAAWAVITSYLERRNLWLATAAFLTMFLLGSGGVERLLARGVPGAMALQPMGAILLASWLVRHSAVAGPWANREEAWCTAERSIRAAA